MLIVLFKLVFVKIQRNVSLFSLLLTARKKHYTHARGKTFAPLLCCVVLFGLTPTNSTQSDTLHNLPFFL